MNAKFTLLVAGLFAPVGAVHATDLNYDFVQVGYAVVDFDDFDEDLEGVSIDASFLVADELFVFGGYADGKTDRFTFLGERGRIGVSGYTLGLGYRYAVSRQTDFNFAAAFERQKAEGRSGLSFLGSESDNGYSLLVGVRHLATREFELGADVTYVDVTADDTILTVGGLWHITDLVAVGLSYSVGSDAKGFQGGIRFKF